MVWNEKVLKLCIPENCFTIWNSKTIHANTGITKKHKITKINRLTVCILMLPRELQSEKIRKKRIEARINGKTCSHWSNKCELKSIRMDLKKDI